jgi:UDP-N-acetylmuramate dehydrogenase
VHPARSNLADYTTLRLGGPARRFVTATSESDIRQIVHDSDANGDKTLILAGGSNVVVADAGFDGTVILIRNTGVSARRDGADVEVTVQAGEEWEPFVARAVAEGWSGVECLSGVPGSAGATPMQNVGAYGQEVAELISGVRVLDRDTSEVAWRTAPECGFGYRTSVFRGNRRWVVLAVTLRLHVSKQSAPVRYAELAAALDVPTGTRVDTAAARDAVLRLRVGKGMVLDGADPDTYSAGSFFTNPVLDGASFDALSARAADIAPPPAWRGADGMVKTSAAWLIENAGFKKGYGSSRVAISTKHTLALTNRGDGTTAELLALAREIRDGVVARFGVELHLEPVLVNCEL